MNNENKEIKVVSAFEYAILESTSRRSIQETVNIMLEKGWELQGGISHANGMGGQLSYCQAMTRQKAIKTES